ncbi:MAG: virulence factor family protein [Ramlibacter sp.]|nr:virulence factor family protein [Ramlibacter sp.]
MFLKAGALSLGLLLASRLLGLLRESAQAAAFGASGMGDVVVLMLTLPDWLTGVIASGALAYVLVPAWAGQSHAQVVATQRKVARALLIGGGALALLLALWPQPAVGWLAGGLPAAMRAVAAQALIWSALALPAALLAALWATRLQHEQDFAGMYGANLVVNGTLVAAIAWAATRPPGSVAVTWLGAGLFAAMFLRLAWLRWRTPALSQERRVGTAARAALPRSSVWLWASFSAGLPLALPFAARSIASQSGEGALATFNYAWKLVELPLLLAIQLVATLALPAIAKAVAARDERSTAAAVRNSFALAWALACAAAAALLVGAPAIATLLFGWGRMDASALSRVAQWGAIGAWGLLPQAVIAVTLAVLAARGEMKLAVLAYSLALAALLAYAASGLTDGARLMAALNALQLLVAVIVAGGLGAQLRGWLPWRSMLISLLCLVVLAGFAAQVPLSSWGLWPGLSLAALAGFAVMAATWWASADLRAALAR